MTSSNRTRVAVCRESTVGTTPNTPRMRTMRITGESLSFTPEYVDSDEVRSDRMLGDPIKVMQASQGGLNFELSYPEDNTPLSEVIRSALFATWTNTPTFDNDGTADSVCTQVTDSTDTFTVASGGAAAVAGHLIRTTGFTNAANNGIFKVGSSTGTTIVVAGTPTLTDEAAPPAAAKIKVVGFQGASGDITATSTGLGSTLLDFTTLGLAVGQWIKIGGTATGDKFATAACNGFARVTAIAAHALTCDNLPSGWTTDSGASKTIKVWFGDQIKNGTTVSSMTIEKGFMGQTTPTYIYNTGMVANTLELTFQSRQKITGSVNFMGMGGGQDTTSLDSSPDAETTNSVMACHANVGRLAENGSTLTDPNWARSFSLNVNNNIEMKDAVDSTSPVGHREGECTVTGNITTYFGSNSLLAKLYAGTATSINVRAAKDSQAIILQVPRATLRSGVPAAGGKNQNVELSSDFQASKDTLTSAHVIIDRIPYYE
ncbi:hypothetical protein CCR97_08285 [Rhodoplanes elegans]|uniref:Uncharacterized protein n=1 Tax=Rhodoplanes elegans TaxID=29408 RepID=A0A327KUP3_9BRAD|nr:phage tail tube protein [Rhodoplanes elegans]MBK5958117.1 hypothetical protein [Rhodoplanes elegans]MBK5958209.1 hypothetical protein [Rhodoplanes elegans]RAI41991.1 hypothetical protein CH338_01425 [Rhodoplanes elegans]